MTLTMRKIEDVAIAEEAHVDSDRECTWSLSLIANRRLIIRINSSGSDICDVNLEVY